jgi:hypothetical protein
MTTWLPVGGVAARQLEPLSVVIALSTPVKARGPRRARRVVGDEHPSRPRVKLRPDGAGDGHGASNGTARS